MRIAIACPGPSLVAAAEQIRAGYDLIIGVNRAPVILSAVGIAVSDWCFDAKAFIAATREGFGVRGSGFREIRVFTSRNGEADIAKAGLWEKYRTHALVQKPGTWDDLMFVHPAAETGWTNYSATAAVILAMEIIQRSEVRGQRSEVHGFGMDWTPEAADADGVRLPGDRSAARFESERVIWEKTVAYAAGLGVTVERMREQKTVDRSQKTEVRGQKTEVRGQRS